MQTADSALEPTYLTTLTQVAAAFRSEGSRPSASTVVAALLQAETAAKQQRLTYPLDSLLGTWRLCFFTGTRKARQRGGIRLGRGWYAPKFVRAQISFRAEPMDGDRAEIANQLQIGPINLKLTGPARYPGKKNLLAFDFTQMQFALADRTLWHTAIRGGSTEKAAFDTKSIAHLPFFGFFLITPDFMAARGRGGGLAVWVRE